jgi:DNA-binding transcriptional ArsR family regulator
VLTILARERRCVCDLQEMVPVPMNLLSYQLRELRQAGLVQVTKRGRRPDYQLAPGALERLRAALPWAGRQALAASAENTQLGTGTSCCQFEKEVGHGPLRRRC